jgi:O-antigen ligase
MDRTHKTNTPAPGPELSESEVEEGPSRRQRDRVRLTPIYRIGDGITEGVLYFMVVFSPWAFGTTQLWSIRVMNGAGFFLGVLLLAKWLIRWRSGYRPNRWMDALAVDESATNRRRIIRCRILTRLLAALTGLILAYCLVSAVNARATYYHAEHRFDYHECVEWLPHSYDQAATWFAFWTYLGLACSFWAIRDWLLGKTRKEIRTELETVPDLSSTPPLPFSPSNTPLSSRLRRLLWVLCFNAALLGLVSIVQRLDSTNKLLWLVQPRVMGGPDFHFGPYAYRSNAAQYFNLIWPVCIGFWWSLRAQFRAERRSNHRVGSSPHVVLLPAAVLIAACPIISTSRGGALLFFIGVPLVVGVIVWTSRQRKQRWGSLLAVLFCLLALGLYLGWQPLSKRLQGLKNLSTDQSSVERFAQYESTRQMITDFPFFGVGPYAYTATYLLYKKPQQTWYPYAHNDWLQVLVEWGGAGSAVILAALLLAWGWPVTTGIARSPIIGTLMVSVFLVMTHAVFDFPLQIHSLLFTTLLLLTVLTSPPAHSSEHRRLVATSN